MEIYKKYRPKTLERMVGNTETVETLKKMMLVNTLPHCILFSGPSGVGKTTAARILCMELDCNEMDLSELNCSSFRGIDTIRDIQRVMNLAPVGGKTRIWILDEFHQMTKDGQNAALKMLEDTPSHVYFFICTTDPQKLLPTVLTRCSHMPLRLLNDNEMCLLLNRVMKKEEITLSDESVSDLISLSAGSPRRALVLLDKIRNLPADKQQAAMESQDEEEKQAIDLCRALIKQEPWEKVAGILKKIKTEPEQVRWSVLGYARSVLLGSSGKGGHRARAYAIICAFEENLFNSKEAGLARACYEAIYG